MKHPEIVEKMTLEQKAAFVSGYNYWTLNELPELGLPSIMLTDGPHGLRKQNKDKKTSNGIGLGNSVPATCFPPASTSSCSWDEELIEEEGKALADECLKEKVSVILGPGTNIKRSPVCGRNFEYFSEDPYLAGKCAAGLVKGVQSKGIGTSLKHFACNSQEAFRMVVNEVVDDRALREIYLTAFEICRDNFAINKVYYGLTFFLFKHKLYLRTFGNSRSHVFKAVIHASRYSNCLSVHPCPPTGIMYIELYLMLFLTRAS